MDKYPCLYGCQEATITRDQVAKVARQTEVLFAKQVCHVAMVARCVSHDLSNPLTTHFLFQR